MSEWIERYSKQLLLKNFGTIAQNKLKKTKVLIAGCGGLGCPVIQYLTAAGVENFSLYDPDSVELSNLNRQILYCQNDIDKNKVECAAKFIKQQNINAQVIAKAEWLTVHNIRKIIAEHDLILDCTDGWPNKLLLNDACMLEKRPLIHGAASAFAGRILTITPQSACLRCIFETPLLENPDQTCQNTGILGTTCGVVGSIMATEAIKLITQFNDASVNHYIYLSLEGLPRIETLLIAKNPQCLVCSGSITLLENNYSFENCF